MSAENFVSMWKFVCLSLVLIFGLKSLDNKKIFLKKITFNIDIVSIDVREGMLTLLL